LFAMIRSGSVIRAYLSRLKHKKLLGNIYKMSPLNNKHTFERFVVGPSNQLAHAASIAVAMQPAKKYNPLFIYSGYGLGKTHLLHAIGLLTASVHPEFVIQYVTGEEFMNELFNAIRYDLIPKFREKYSKIDFLLFDDIHYLAGKERTQEEFWRIFRSLHDSEKQIVFASDKFTNDISNLEERLRANFEWGLIIDIQPPEMETRLAIIKNKIKENSIPMSDKISCYIARHVKSNIGELEGFLGLVISYSSLTGREINLDLVKEVLKIAKLDKTRLTRFHSRMFSVIRRKILRKERYRFHRKQARLERMD